MALPKFGKGTASIDVVSTTPAVLEAKRSNSQNVISMTGPTSTYYTCPHCNRVLKTQMGFTHHMQEKHSTS